MSDMPNDTQLAEVVDRLIGDLRQGSISSLEQLLNEHDELAEDLRALWPALVAAESASQRWAASFPDGSLNFDSTSMQGRSIGGDYTIEEELGRGGMGIVYKAHQRSLNRKVALKMVLHGPWASEVELGRFEKEAMAAANLDHPNIVPIFARGEHDGLPFFTMQLIEGDSLSKLIATGPMNGRKAASIMARVARAVEAAHRSGILHRDLKPSNILLDKGGQPFITDFGIAKQIGAESNLRNSTAMTESGAAIGTPSYMAPEQGGRSPRNLITGRSDVYSLGAVLYHTLTGRPPFQAASPMSTLLQVMEQEPVPPRAVNPDIDPELEMICLKCLQKPPELRYATANELGSDLEAFLQGEPVSARSGKLRFVVSRILRPTHHAVIMEHWGVLWMWNSLALLALCITTNIMQWMDVASSLPYMALWSVGLTGWAGLFWAMRRRIGPVTFVERQIAHGWAAGISGSVGVFMVEMFLGLPVLTLAPLMAVISGMVFLVKAGTLSGAYYFASAAHYLTAAVMTLLPSVGLTIYGIVSAACFFIPGFRAWQQQGPSAQ